jgi:hypothetical protein
MSRPKYMRCGNDKLMPKRVLDVLRRITPICRDLTADEQAWVTSACLRLLTMKIESERGF